LLDPQAEVAAQSVTAAALTLDAHIQKLAALRDEAKQRGQMRAAIRAEELRGQLKHIYVNRWKTAMRANFERMSDEKLRA
jgi:hypothetical protein